MLKANTKYTASEVLKEAGFEKPEEMIGKMRVRIAGIHGIVKPDHLVKFQPETKEVEVIVGVESKTLKLEKAEASQVVGKETKTVLEAKGEEATEKANAIAEAKLEAAKKTNEVDITTDSVEKLAKELEIDPDKYIGLPSGEALLATEVRKKLYNKFLLEAKTKKFLKLAKKEK